MAAGFVEVVKRVIGKWSALQIAIAHGMGGPFVREKEEWLCNVITDFFNQNSDLDPDEVGEYIGEILNNEFDTLIEDGSLEDICLRLIKYYKWFHSNESDKILPDLETIRVEVPIVGNRTENHNNVPKELNNEATSVTTRSVTTDVVSQMQDLSIQSEETDEWTVVSRSNRKARPK